MATKTAAKTAPAKAVAEKPAAAKPIKKEHKQIKLPAGYKPTQKEGYMCPEQMEYFRQKLVKWRDDLIEESRLTIDHLKEENWHESDIADRASLETEAGVELEHFGTIFGQHDAGI